VAAIARSLRAAGLSVATTDLDGSTRAAGPPPGWTSWSVAYRVPMRHRAWSVLTALRGAREVRHLPVIVAPFDLDRIAAAVGQSAAGR
jgi:hypothetical protein